MPNTVYDTGSQALNALATAKSFPAGSLLTLNQIVGSGTVGDAVGALYNPQNIGQNVGAQALLSQEVAYFSKWYYNTFVKPAPAGYLREFFDSKFTVGLIGLQHAKQNVGNKGVYGGPGNALHTQAIRPITSTASDTTPRQTWIDNSVTAGWQTGYFDLDLTKSSATADLNLLNNVEMLVLGLADFSVSPKVLEYQFQENGNKPLGVQSHPLNLAQDGDTVSLDVESYLIPTNTKYSVDVNFSSSGAAVPAIIGIQYVSDVYYGQE